MAAGQAARLAGRKERALEEAKRLFRPELLGRLDEAVVFSPLEGPALEQITEQLLDELEQRAYRSGYRLCHTHELTRELARRGHSAYRCRAPRRQA